MSKMGRAVLWVQENGLQDDPAALSKYVNQQDKDGRRNKQSEAKHGKDSEDRPRPGGIPKGLG